MITSTVLTTVLPGNKKIEEWVPVLNDILPKFGITTKLRIAAFLAESAYESNNYISLTENLNYSLNGLMKTWPTRFKTVQFTTPYARNPEKIANYVYSNRLGNGDEQSGDGWKFRGRGIFQLTGKDNYRSCSKDIYKDENILLNNPDLLIAPAGAILSACWFWNKNNLSVLADKGDIDGISKTINGGKLGIVARSQKYTAILSIKDLA